MHRVSTTINTLSSSLFHVRSPIIQYDLQQPKCIREQPNPTTQAIATEQWICLILTYARHRRLFILHVECVETVENDWGEILRNERINREYNSFLTPSGYLMEVYGTGKITPTLLSNIVEAMVEKNLATYEPPKQARSILAYLKNGRKSSING